MQTQSVEQYPVTVEVQYPEKSSRLLALATILFFLPRLLILLPHLVILYFLGFVGLLAWVIAQFAVLFTGKYPKTLFNFVVGYTRWNTRVSAYMMGLTDKYPPMNF